MDKEIQDLLSKFDKETLIRLLEMNKREEEKAEKEANKNPMFVQLNKHALPSLSFLSAENGLASAILVFLFDKMTVHNAVACSYTALQEHFTASRSSIYRAIKLLQDKKFIQVAKMGNVNVYHLNDNLVWKAGYNQRKYAEFSATIVLSESEQQRNSKTQKEMKKLNALVKNKNKEV